MEISQSIGIDVGKDELVVRIRRSDGATDEPALFPNAIIGFKKLIVHFSKNNIGTDDPILLESTGPYHWKAARSLADSGYFVKIANPLHTKQIARLSLRKRKTDTVDAGHLAFLASQGYGYRFIETEEMARKKALVRHFWKLRQSATDHLRHERYLKEHRGISGYTVSGTIERQCGKLKTKIVAEFSAGNNLRYLDSIPGVTPLLAASILAEITPLSRFERIEQIIAYAGLDPSVKQSGGKPAHYSKLSKRGSALLRRVLYFAAFGSFHWQPFNPYYRAYKDRGLHHTTILGILQRKILRIAVALLKKREVFDKSYLGAVDKND